jgi:hypothetical protein
MFSIIAWLVCEAFYLLFPKRRPATRDAVGDNAAWDQANQI